MPLSQAPLHLMGWQDDPRRHAVAAKFGTLFGVAPALARVVRGGDVLLYKAWTDVLGHEPAYVAQEIGDCFPAGTMVWGERMLPIERVRPGDRVWTAQGKLTTVVSTRAIEVARPLVRVHAVGSLPIDCTPDHRFLVYRLGHANGARVTSALYERAKAGGAGIPKRTVIERYEGRRPEWVAAGDLTGDDCLLTPLTLELSDPPEDSPNGLCSTDEGMWALGFFLGNGNASGGSVEFALSDRDSTARVIAGLESAGFHPKEGTYRPECGAWRIRAHSRDLVRALRRDFYDDDGVKVFPWWAIGDPAFLAGLEAADGSGRGGVHSVDSTSRSIVGGLVAGLIGMGFDPTVNLCSRSEGTYDNARPLYRVTWRDRKQKQYVWRDEAFLCRPVWRLPELIEGPTVVYDIGVADPHHSFLVDGHGVHNCVSHGYGHANDLLQCIEMVIAGSTLDYRETLTEFIYGAGREAGGMLGPQDGCCGSFMAQALTTIGMMPRESVQSPPYDGKRAKAWGTTGPPPDLEHRAAAYKVGAATLVTTWAELVAALGNGYPVPICSDQGFTMVRDKEGICEAQGTWNHCMVIIGLIGETAVIGQSWGPNTPSGPVVMSMPSFSFRARRKVVEHILSQRDSFALSATQAFATRDLPLSWSYSSYV